MPITRSAAKRMGADKKRRLRNIRFISELKTLTKRFHGLLKEKAAEKAQGLLKILMKRLDQAASKGIIHPNTAARKKSRLSRRLSVAPSRKVS